MLFWYNNKTKGKKMGNVKIKKISDFLIKGNNKIIDTNIYIISEGSKAIMVDCGGGVDKAISYLSENNLNLKYIFLTHSHFDHIYYLDLLKERYPKAQIIASQKTDLDNLEINMLESLGEENRKSKVDIFVKDKDRIHLEKGENVFLDKDIKDKVKINMEDNFVDFSVLKSPVFEVIETPGHTYDSISLLMKYDEKTYLFSGDTIFKDSIGRTDFPGGSSEYMVDTLRKLKRILEDNCIILPGHGENTLFSDWKKVFYRI